MKDRSDGLLMSTQLETTRLDLETPTLVRTRLNSVEVLDETFDNLNRTALPSQSLREGAHHAIIECSSKSTGNGVCML